MQGWGVPRLPKLWRPQRLSHLLKRDTHRSGRVQLRTQLLHTQGDPVLTGLCWDGADVKELCLQVGVMYEAVVDNFHEIRQSSEGTVGSPFEFVAC